MDNQKKFMRTIGNLSAEIYQNLKTAVELGKWRDGSKLSQEQLELCMQAIIIWEQKNLSADQCTGYIQDKCKSHSQQNVITVNNLQ